MSYFIPIFIQIFLFIQLLVPPTPHGMSPDIQRCQVRPVTTFEGKIKRSPDQGDHWEDLSAGLPTDIDIMAVRTYGQRCYVGSTLDQIYISTARPVQAWSRFSMDQLPKLANDMPKANIRDFFPTPTGLYTYAVRAGVFRKKHGEFQWKRINTPLGLFNVDEITEDPAGRIFLANHDGIQFSDDDGKSWTRADFPGNALSVRVLGDHLLASGNEGIFLSQDRGVTWTPAKVENDPFAFPFPDGVLSYRIARSESALLAIRMQTPENKGTAGRVLMSRDGGASWQIHPADAYLKGLDRLASLIADAAGNIYCSYRGGVIRSKDHGKTWTTLFDYQNDDIRMVPVLELDHGILYCTEVAVGC